MIGLQLDGSDDLLDGYNNGSRLAKVNTGDGEVAHVAVEIGKKVSVRFAGSAESTVVSTCPMLPVVVSRRCRKTQALTTYFSSEFVVHDKNSSAS